MPSLKVSARPALSLLSQGLDSPIQGALPRSIAFVIAMGD